MSTALLSLQDIRLTWGGAPLFAGVNLFVRERDRICLVGRNGSGKSTLLKIAAGQIEPDAGERFVHPGATVRYLEQEPDLTRFATVAEYVAAGLAPGDDPHRARRFVEDLGLTGAESTKALSGGEARRAAIARALAPDPDVLLLDEPTNHLDIAAIEQLEALLKSARSAIVIISHDRRFLANLTRRTLWLDRGVSRSLDQGFAAFETWRDETFEAEEAAAHKLDRKIAAEEDWVRYGVTARRKRNMRRMGELDDLRTARRDARRATGTAALAAAEGKLSGRLVIEAEGIAKRYGARTIVESFSTKILRGDRVGLVGPNGAGKTTLLNMLTGALPADEGGVRLGSNLEIASLDQKRARLDPQTALKDALTEGRGDQVMVNGQPRHVIAYMKDFLFKPEQARSPLSSLSGGERGRLMLAIALAKPSNLLVLDEPTNDLDLETLDLLQDVLGEYQGTVLLVSHDRDFLDRVATSVIAPDGDGRWIEFAGGWTDMERQRAGGRAESSSGPPSASAAKSPAKAKGEASGEPSALATAKRGKLSFKDKHALETLPAKIAALQSEIATLAAALGDPGLYVRDPKRFDATTAAAAKAQAELDAAEALWLDLEMKREEIEGR